MLCACRRRSRASLHRLSFSMTFISWPVRLCSAADCSSAAATGPARGAVKCVDEEKGRSNGSFSLRPLSSLEHFCVRHRGCSVPSRGLPRNRESGSLCGTQNPLSDDSRSRPSPERRPFKRPFLFSTHSHVASRGSGGGATVAKPRDGMLVRCFIPSARYALSAAAVWPPAGLPDAPLLENAS